MPQQKAAFKAIKVSNKKRIRNESVINEVKTLTKKFNVLVSSKDAAGAKKTLTTLIKKINKAKSKNALHKKTASRKISRIMKKAAKLK